MKLHQDKQMLYVRSMGKLLKVTAIFTDEAAANYYMENVRDEGVVAEFRPFIFMANLHDHGLSVKLDDKAA